MTSKGKPFTKSKNYRYLQRELKYSHPCSSRAFRKWVKRHLSHVYRKSSKQQIIKELGELND